MDFLRYLMQIFTLLGLALVMMPLHSADAFPNHPITLVAPYPARALPELLPSRTQLQFDTDDGLRVSGAKHGHVVTSSPHIPVVW
jgi:hypothetical protein